MKKIKHLQIFLLSLLINYSIFSQTNKPIVGAIRWDFWDNFAPEAGLLDNYGPGATGDDFQERIPFFAKLASSGKYEFNGNSQSVMNAEIDYARNAGIDYFAFLWYPEQHFNGNGAYGRKLFKNATNKKGFKFVHVLGGWTGFENLVDHWSPQEFVNVNQMILDFYRDDYMKINGKPLVYFFGSQGAEDVMPASLVEDIKNRCKLLKPGILDSQLPYFVNMKVNGVGDANDTYNKYLTRKIDATSSYNSKLIGINGSPYTATIDGDQQSWQNYVNLGGKISPTITMGWNQKPRVDKMIEGVRGYPYWNKSATPEEFRERLNSAVGFCNANTSKTEAGIMMYAWNEYSEGGYICPALSLNGTVNTTYLDAIREVLKPLDLDTETICSASDGGTFGPIQIKATKPWTVTTTASHQITKTYTNGYNGYIVVKINPLENNSNSIISTININLDGTNVTKTISVKQNRHPFSCYRLDRKNLPLFAQTGNIYGMPGGIRFPIFRYPLASSISLNVGTDSWIKYTITENSIIINPDENTGNARTGIIVVDMVIDNLNYTDEITVNQLGSFQGNTQPPIEPAPCIVNKVILTHRGDCCPERLLGAKIRGSNDNVNWTDLYTINVNGAGSVNNVTPPQEFTFPNSQSYKFVRFEAGPNGYGELREIAFYNNSTKVTGTYFGSNSFYNNLSWTLATDGNSGSNYWHGAGPGAQNYVGIDLTNCIQPQGALSVSNIQISGCDGSQTYKSVSWTVSGGSGNYGFTLGSYNGTGTSTNQGINNDWTYIIKDLNNSSIPTTSFNVKTGGCYQSACSNCRNGVLENDYNIEIEKNSNQLTVSPNPIKDIVNIAGNSEIQNTFLTTQDGIIVSSFNFDGKSKKEKINVSSLNSGLYLLKVKTKLGEYIKKIIKE